MRTSLRGDWITFGGTVVGAIIVLSLAYSDDVTKKNDELIQQKERTQQQKHNDEIAEEQKQREEKIFQGIQQTKSALDIASKKKEIIRIEKTINNFNIYPPLNPAITNDPVKRRSIELYNKGVSLQRDGKEDEAEQEFRSAIALNQKVEGAHNNLGVILIHRNNVQGAILEYNIEISYYPNNPISHFNLGIALSRTNDTESALTEFQTDVMLAPTDIAMRNELALFYIEVGDMPTPANKVNDSNRTTSINISKAIDILNQSLSNDPHNAYAMSLLGLAWVFRGNLERLKQDFKKSDTDYYNAKHNLDKALELDPQNAHVRLTYARAYAYRGELVNAMIFLRKAIELDGRLRLEAKYAGEFEPSQDDPEFKKRTMQN